MQVLLVLLLLYLFVVLVILPIWTIVKITAQQREIAELRQRLAAATLESPSPTPKPAEAPSVELGQTPAAIAPVLPAVVAPVTPPPPPLPPVMAAAATPPPSFTPALEAAKPAEPPALSASTGTPPLISPAPRPAPPVYRPPPPRPTINWEQFMGAKLFAWLGGLALFLGVAFFVKYSFEHDLIPPEIRVSLGFLLGIGLVIGGLKIPRDRYDITAQTLIAAGVVSLYAVTFACNAIYHFPFFGVIPTFLLMTLITATAFILAVRLGSQVVAILGLLGGFLTPVLLSTGVDNPGGLFGYLALLVMGLAAVALHRRWFYLVPLGVAGVVLMLLGWADKFYTTEKAGIAMTICVAYSALYLATYLVARRLGRAAAPVLWASVVVPAVAFGFALFFADSPVVGARAGLLFGFILVSDGMLLTLVWLDERLEKLHFIAGLAAFALLALWTSENLTDALLPWALAAYLGFAALHAVFPLLLERRRPASAASWWSQLFPPLGLFLVLLPIFRLETASWLLWPAILLVDVLAIGLAVASASLAAVGVVLVFTLVATGACLFKVPESSILAPSLLLVIGGFALFFVAAGAWLTRKLGDRLPMLGADGPLARVFGSPRAQLPAFASLLPFLLLIMACSRLAVPDPSAVFGLGLLLVILTLGLAAILGRRSGREGDSVPGGEWLPLCALAGIATLEFAWHSRQFAPAAPGLPLAWYLGFYLIFTLYPFLFLRRFAGQTGPWAVAALGGLAHFWIVYQALRRGWPDGWTKDFPGAIPILFALAPLAGMAVVLKAIPAHEPRRLNQLAWFGGVALFFITLVFPIQFERQWLTVAWALEGAALLWLFHRVPHPGLRGTGAVLLVTAFVRLALNPAVFAYHVRGDTPVLNWYLYAYGLTLAALFIGARLVTAPGADGAPDGRVLGINAPPLFNTLGLILAFVLLNIEIADYFTVPGARSLAFQFSGNFARDMSYTIAWALFALGLLSLGIWKKARAARYAAIALLSIALLKLFLHDLARLEALYRIGALFAVAVIAILASLAYQRFLPSHEKTPQAPE